MKNTDGSDRPAKGTDRVRKREKAFMFVAGGPVAGLDERKLQSLLSSFVPVANGAQREFELDENTAERFTLPLYRMLLAPIAGTITLSKFGVSVTGKGATFEDTLVSASGEARKFACKLTLDHDAFMRIAASCGHNALHKLSGASKVRWEEIKKEATAKQTVSSGSKQAP
jgi:hypothetical protein